MSALMVGVPSSACKGGRPRMAVTPERMTLAEFLTLPEVKPALELRHGVVSQKVPPSGPHISVYVLRPGGEVGPLREGDAIDITDVLPGFKLSVSDLFARYDSSVCLHVGGTTSWQQGISRGLASRRTGTGGCGERWPTTWGAANCPVL